MIGAGSVRAGGSVVGPPRGAAVPGCEASAGVPSSSGGIGGESVSRCWKWHSTRRKWRVEHIEQTADLMGRVTFVTPLFRLGFGPPMLD